jgi:hypothetical protein
VSRQVPRSATFVLAATLAVLVVPIALDLWLSPDGVARRLFAYAAADTFYYLTVARNIGLHGRFAFDGQLLSNGYHPLWQLVTSLPYALHLPRAETPWVLAYLMGAALAAQVGALILLARAWRRPDGTLSSLFLFIPAGVYALCASPAWLSKTTVQLAQANSMEGAEPVYGTWWSYVNGMESSLVLLFFAAVLWLSARERPLARPVWLGLALAGLALARLDHALIAAPILLGLCLDELRRGRGWRRLEAPALATAAFALPLVAYVVINRSVFGAALPVSGALKSSFPAVSADDFHHLIDNWNRGFLGEKNALTETWRILQQLIPALFALAAPFVLVRIRLQHGHLVVAWASPHPEMARVLLLTAAGILCLTGYNFLFVFFFSLGHWYVPVSTVFPTLLCLFGIERARAAWRLGAPAPASTRWRWALPVVGAALAGALFIPLHRSPGYHLRYANFAIEEAPRLRASLAGQNPKIIDCDDGIVAYASEFPTMSGTGLGLDVEGVRARRSPQGQLPLALSRGFVYVAALVYVDPKGPDDDVPAHVLEWVAKQGAITQLGDVKKYKWSVAYRSPERNFAVLKVTEP